MASIYLGLLIIAYCSLTGWAQNINCGLRTRRVVTVDNTTRYTLTTQRKGQTEYKDDTECRVLYKQGPTCRTMEFSCSKVAVKARWNKPSEQSSKRFCFGDFMRVRRYGEDTRYCRGSKPEAGFNSTGPITVFFKSNPSIVSTGAECEIRCVEDTSEWKGEITSPGYPGTYDDDWYTPYNGFGLDALKVAPGYVIRFTYVVFEADCSILDEFVLEEYDSGFPINLGRQCGKKEDGDVFVSTTNKVYYVAEFLSCAGPCPPLPGMKIKWEAIPDPTLRMAENRDYDLEELEKDYSW